MHFKLHEWRNWKQSKQWSKGEKKNHNSLIVWNLSPSQNSLWNMELLLPVMLQTKVEHSLEHTVHWSLATICNISISKKPQISSIIPKFLQYQFQLLQVPPFYYFLPSDSLVCNHYIPSIRDMHEIKLARAPICIWINYLE